MSEDLVFKSFLQDSLKTRIWAFNTIFKICYKFFFVYLATKSPTEPVLGLLIGLIISL